MPDHLGTTTPLYDEHGEIFAVIDDEHGTIHAVIPVRPLPAAVPPQAPVIEADKEA